MGIVTQVHFLPLFSFDVFFPPSKLELPDLTLRDTFSLYGVSRRGGRRPPTIFLESPFDPLFCCGPGHKQSRRHVSIVPLFLFLDPFLLSFWLRCQPQRRNERGLHFQKKHRDEPYNGGDTFSPCKRVNEQLSLSGALFRSGVKSHKCPIKAARLHPGSASPVHKEIRRDVM